MYNDKLLFEKKTAQEFGEEFELVLPEHAYLSEQRKAMGLSQQQVAVAAGINLRQYQRLESGERSMCSASLRIGLAVCDVLGLDPHRFVPTHPHAEVDPADGCRYIKIEERPNHRMKKYKVFRSLGKVDEGVQKHELVDVVYGRDIHAVTDKLMKAVNDDAIGLSQYEKGFTAFAKSPERIDGRQVKRYQYCMLVILEPDYGEQNDLLEYGIMEEDAEPGAVAEQE